MNAPESSVVRRGLPKAWAGGRFDLETELADGHDASATESFKTPALLAVRADESPVIFRYEDVTNLADMCFKNHCIAKLVALSQRERIAQTGLWETTVRNDPEDGLKPRR